jgi:ribosomal-protein-alanine N-acetyltransferase
MIQIVKGEKQHLHSLVEIENECFSQPWSEKAMSDELDAENGIFLTALDNGDSVAFCALRLSFEEAELYQIAVRDQYRGLGIAGALLSDALSRVRCAGGEKILLEVRASNLPALGLYKKFGFYQIARRKNYYDAPREDAVIMQLDIDSVVEKC